MRYGANMNYEFTARALIYSHLRDIIIEYVSTRRVSYGGLNWNPSFQFASLSSDLANRLHK